MINKKVGVLIFAFISVVLLASFISAELTLKKETVSSMAIPELNLPAIFNVDITNLGNDDVFTIYSLAGVLIEPNYTVSISHGATQRVTVTAMPTFESEVSPNYYSFEYKIKGETAGIQTDQLAISIVDLKDAFNINIEDINIDSQTVNVDFENKGGHTFDNVKLEMSSAFFTETFEFPVINAYESKTIVVNLKTDAMKELLAGPYIVNTKITIGDNAASTSAVVNFNEKPEISTTQSTSGWIIQVSEVEKKNNGNTETDVSIIVTKNFFSALFTSFNIAPTKKEVSGFGLKYIFAKELSPNDSLRVTATTNWWVFLVAIVVILVIYYLVDKFVREKLVLKKRVQLVRTKGGEFALKVTITARARDFVEKIRIFDRLPPMVKVFERYGLSAPDKVDSKNRRLEWDIAALGRGEVRELSYIVYSKIGLLGKFELPAAEAIYEYIGKIKESQSNRTFFMNEPKNKA